MTLQQRTNPGLSSLGTFLLTALLWGSNAHSETLVDSALRFFIGNDSNTADFDLDRSRPQPVPPDFRTTVLKSLPKEGRIAKLKAPQRQKLESLDIVLRLQERQSIYELAVFESLPKPYAFIGLHHRAVLLISDIALNLLDTAELQASVAHEIGHEYVWAEYLDAAKRNDDRRLKELELICDGVAILTLRRAGIDPAALLAAAEKITKFNASSTGPAGNAHRYPSKEERQKFARAIMTWADSQRSTHIRIEGQPTGVPQRSVMASSSDGGDPFIAAIETAKRSVAALDCVSVSGSQSRILEPVGSAILLSGAGDFLTAAHVIAGMQNPKGSCPTPALTLPAGDWRPEARTEDMRWFPFQASRPAERTVTVYALDNGLNTRGVLYQAQQMAAKMFAEVGVRLDWRTGRPSGTRTQRNPVIVVSLAEHAPAGYSPEALASAKVYEGVHISVFWDRVAGLSRFAPPAVVLAHVLVHEITHILQGVDRHSETGVMKAQWTPEDFHAMASKPLLFTPVDVKLIRLGLAPTPDRGEMAPTNSALKTTN